MRHLDERYPLRSVPPSECPILSQFHYDPKIQITTFETMAEALHDLSEESEQ